MIRLMAIEIPVPATTDTFRKNICGSVRFVGGSMCLGVKLRSVRPSIFLRRGGCYSSR